MLNEEVLLERGLKKKLTKQASNYVRTFSFPD